MTEEKVELKISELEEVKKSLIRKSKLMDPSNQSIFYSTKPISETRGTEGVTPMAITAAMGKVGDTILDYIDEMRGMPFIKTSPIQSNKVKTKVAIDTSIDYATALLKKIGDGLHLRDIIPFMSEARVVSSVNKIVFTTGTRVESEDRKTSIPYEIVLYRINSFSNDITTFRSGTGDLHVEITADYINQDDIYVLGVVFKEHINPNIPYYADLSFLIEKTMVSSEKIEKRGTIGGLGIGVQNLDVDSSLDNGMLLFSIFGSTDIIVSIDSEVETSVAFAIGDIPFSPTGKYDGNTMSAIGTRGKMIQIKDKKISLWEGCGISDSMHDGLYDLYESGEEAKEKIIFNNLRPIDFSIQEAIDDL